MKAWELSPAAWLDRPGAWQPAGIDDAVQADTTPLRLAAPGAMAWCGQDVPAGSPVLALHCGGARVSAGPAIMAAAVPLRLCPGAGTVAMDALAGTAGQGRMVLVVHRAANRYDGWRVLRAGVSGTAGSPAGTSRPAVRVAAVSSLAADGDTMTQHSWSA
jgi:hypothetical protein